jgi:hypothetical protein
MPEGLAEIGYKLSRYNISVMLTEDYSDEGLPRLKPSSGVGAEDCFLGRDLLASRFDAALKERVKNLLWKMKGDPACSIACVIEQSELK